MKTHCGFGSISEKVDLQPEGETALVGLGSLGLESATKKLRPKGTYQLCKVNEEGGHTSLWSLPPKAGAPEAAPPDESRPTSGKGKKK